MSHASNRKPDDDAFLYETGPSFSQTAEGDLLLRSFVETHRKAEELARFVATINSSTSQLVSSCCHDIIDDHNTT
jgi:hypothetical protein